MARYSHSKIDTFKKCPKQYDYENVQNLEPLEENVHLTVGKLFHSTLEAIMTFKDYDEYLKEFAGLVRKGLLPGCDEDTLKVTVEEYLKHYNEIDAHNDIIYVEKKFEHLTPNLDVISGVIDLFYARHGFNYCKDYKTTLNKLKQQQKDVVSNRQINFYSYVLEKDMSHDVHFMEIDEVHIHRLDPVPYLNNGKPSKNVRLLAYVRYEDYYEALSLLGLENDDEYRNVLLTLTDRGHPLFRRITVPVVKELRDNVYKEYLSVIKAIEPNPAYRVKGPLCAYCPFQTICDMEFQGGQDEAVDEIKRTFFKVKEE